MFGGATNCSMVLGYVQGGTRLVPGRPGGENYPSQYCECLYKSAANCPRSCFKPPSGGVRAALLNSIVR